MTLEFAYWFDLLLPGLAALDLPVPTCGSSNHFSIQRLKALGGWDPYNVTEDLDLGMRIHLAGGRTAVFDSATLSEACSEGRGWAIQRARWMKGCLQTWLTQTRSSSFVNATWRSRLAFRAMMVGEPALNLLGPLVLGTAAIGLILLSTGTHIVATPFLLIVLAVTLALAGLSVYCVGAALMPQRRWHLVTAAVAIPLFNLMTALPTCRAIWRLFRHPHVWEKTPHGLSGSDTDPGRR